MTTEAIPIPFEKLAGPAQRALMGAGCRTLQQLAKAREAHIASLHGIGPNALVVLKRELRARHLGFQKGRP